MNVNVEIVRSVLLIYYPCFTLDLVERKDLKLYDMKLYDIWKTICLDILLLPFNEITFSYMTKKKCVYLDFFL